MSKRTEQMNQSRGNSYWSAVGMLPALVIALFCCIFLSRLYEWALLYFKHGSSLLDFQVMTGGLALDLYFSLIAALLLLFVYMVGNRYLPFVIKKLLPALIVVLTLVNCVVVIYFSIVLTPLGSEFWAYSFSEVSDTVQSSAAISVYSVGMLVIIGLVCFKLAEYLLNITISNLFMRSVYLLMIPAVFITVTPIDLSGVFSSSQQYRFAENKLTYFISSSLTTGISSISQDFTEYELQGGEYPFWHRAHEQDPLGPFLRTGSEPPNLVFIIFESLGSDFLDKNDIWGGFAPYLDSLKSHSLYWENGLSMTGRTFGLMPSLFGSLPYGQHGFMDLGPDYPDHRTLISLLDARGYHTSYFSGFNTYFDKLDPFLSYQGIDFTFNKESINGLVERETRSGDNNYWGYDDQTMLRQALTVVDTFRIQPRLEIYHTLQSHSPFVIPGSQRDRYRTRFNDILNSLELSDERKEKYLTYRSELTTLLFTDDAIRFFMENYKNRNRESFDRSIFIITSDHSLIPVPQPNQIARYHVPVLIYSPLLKRTAHFKSVSTHADITPTLISYLKNNYSLALPDSAHWLGTGMDTTREFRNIRSIALMRNKNQLIDYLDEEYYLAGDRVYKLEEGMKLLELTDTELLGRLKSKLTQFKKFNRYAINQNKLFPGKIDYKLPEKYEFITQYDSLFKRIDSLDLSTADQFRMAQRLSFDGDYNRARAICKRLLLGHPDFHDVRTLLGRTYAWDGKYQLAREQFYEVISRDSTYYDVYNALFRSEMWSGNPRKALEIINKGLQVYENNDRFLQQKIEVLITLGHQEKAKEVYNRFEKLYPNHEQIENLGNRLGLN